jgi:DNA-binding CsgD family transcriptional regulator
MKMRKPTPESSRRPFTVAPDVSKLRYLDLARSIRTFEPTTGPDNYPTETYSGVGGLLLRLTVREHQVAIALASGVPIDQIPRLLFTFDKDAPGVEISDKTVKNHLAEVYAKLPTQRRHLSITNLGANTFKYDRSPTERRSPTEIGVTTTDRTSLVDSVWQYGTDVAIQHGIPVTDDIALLQELAESLNIVGDGNNPLDLKPAQLRILHLTALGFSDIEIANILFNSQSTIKNHLAAIYGSLHESGISGVNRNTAVIAGHTLRIYPEGMYVTPGTDTRTAGLRTACAL